MQIHVTANRRVAIAAGMTAASDVFAAKSKAMNFPGDHGIHAEFKNERWQFAGFVKSQNQPLGFQLTFNRTTHGASQLWFAQASVTDTQSARFWLDHRSESKQLSTRRTDPLKIADWTVDRVADAYQVSLTGKAFGINATVTSRQPVLLHGEDGILQTGPDENAIKQQYSLVRSAVSGYLTMAGKKLAIGGDGWVNHEWHNMPPESEAPGFDGFAMNLFDGSFVSAFQTRDPSGNRLWDGGVLRTAKGQRFRFRRGTVVFSRQKVWRSPTTRGMYPVEWIVQTPADFYTVRALVPNQEVDLRPASADVHWNGLSDLFDSNSNHIGRGYLEMNGYAQAKSI